MVLGEPESAREAGWAHFLSRPVDSRDRAQFDINRQTDVTTATILATIGEEFTPLPRNVADL